MLHVLLSQPAIETLKVEVTQMQVKFKRLLQEAGGASPRGMHFCYSKGCLS